MGILNGIIGNAGEVKAEDIKKEYEKILLENENVEAAYKLVRDVFIFTDKRLILVDKQGLTGKKIEYLSILYNSITRFSIETVGHLDLDAELKMWVSGEVQPFVSKRFNKKVNIYDLQKVLAKHLCK